MKIERLTPSTEVLRELGRRLALLRKQRGWSQERLAEAAGVGVATLRRIEDGKDGRLGSWVRLLLSLEMAPALDGLLAEDLRSPMAEVKGRRRRGTRARPQPGAAPGDDDAAPGGFVWGDQKR